ncbi:hypothetical protein MBLNU230_g7176t1 [Neophaeotheca triangularis]
MADRQSPAQPAPEAPVATQKRPLEEPSSPSGPTDQPDAKRPALNKVLQEDGADDASTFETTTDAADQRDSGHGNNLGEPDSTAEAIIDKHGDTALMDAPAVNTNPEANSILQTQPIQAHSGDPSAESTNGASGNKGYSRQDETGWLHVRAIISSAEAATVIGKGGENVSQIRQMAGAKCTVSEYSRGAVERILTVSGLVDAVAKAFGLIIRTLNQESLSATSTAHSKTYPLRLLVPHILIGSIIGKQGVRIREIQELSGARLNASESCLPLSTERSLVVLGVADAVHIATYYVGTTLVEQLTDRFGGPAASAYAVRHGGPQGVVPGGMQVVPYVPQHAGGQHSGPAQYGRQDAGRGRPQQGYGMGYGHEQQPTPVQAQPHYGQPVAPQTPYSGVGPQPPPQQYMGGSAQGPPQAAQPMPGQQAQGAHGQPLTQQIFIPNDMVGAIIGKGGAKINEIRQLSGAVIKINEPSDNSNERLVTVTGTQAANQMALYMLYTRLAADTNTSPRRQRLSFSGLINRPRLPFVLDPNETPVWFRRPPPQRMSAPDRFTVTTPLNMSMVPATTEVPSPASSSATNSPVDTPMAGSPTHEGRPAPMEGVATTIAPSLFSPAVGLSRVGFEGSRMEALARYESRRVRGDTMSARSPESANRNSGTHEPALSIPRSRSPRPRRSPDRLPLRTSFRSFSGVATVFVGEDGSKSRPLTQYLVHKELITGSSPFFAAALNGTFAEGLEQTVRLPEEKPEIFEWFLQWLYTGSLTTPASGATTTILTPPNSSHAQHPQPHPPSAPHLLLDTHHDGDLRNSAGSPKYFLLMDLYALSDRLLTTPLSNTILTTIARLSETTNSVPTPSDTWILCDSIRENSPLRRLVLDLFAYKKTDKLLECHRDEWHPRFLRELVVKLKRPGVEAVERHGLAVWRPGSWSSSRACEGCKEVLKPGVGAEKCVSCDKAFCAVCLRKAGEGWVVGLDTSGCKPWAGRGLCARYHEHAEGEGCC